jgi:hypothetical protein
MTPVSLALLGTAGQDAGQVHDPDLGVAVERTRAAVAEDLLAPAAKVGGKA